MMSDVWLCGKQGGRSNKLSFMMLERGPWAFFQGISKFIQACVVGASPGKKLLAAASSCNIGREAEEGFTIVASKC